MFDYRKKLPFIYRPGVFYKVLPLALLFIIGHFLFSEEHGFTFFEILLMGYVFIGFFLYIMRFINNLIHCYKENPKEFFYYMIAIVAVILMFAGIFYFSVK